MADAERLEGIGLTLGDELILVFANLYSAGQKSFEGTKLDLTWRLATAISSFCQEGDDIFKGADLDDRHDVAAVWSSSIEVNLRHLQSFGYIMGFYPDRRVEVVAPEKLLKDAAEIRNSNIIAREQVERIDAFSVYLQENWQNVLPPPNMQYTIN